MGKGRDKRRKQKGSAVAGQGAAKTQRKTVKNDRKAERRLDRRLEDDEEDIDALLAKFKLEDARRTETRIEEDCDPPSVRVHASYTPIPLEVPLLLDAVTAVCAVSQRRTGDGVWRRV